MDPEADADAAAMAAAMGFSSFGAQDRPQKKRRYNPAVDAVSQSSPSLKDASTGSNSTPLGKQTSTPKQAANEDEIDLEGEDDEQQSGQKEAPRESEGQVPSHHGLPARPAPGTGFVGSRGQPASRERASQGTSAKPWYEGYYDNMSNENPWERIEKKLGLESKGTWVPRQTHPVPDI
ncbi:hypothetical protein VFPPC_12957 [Pochonia chlamydosporia 170]|uniref:Uncharacterized protein n=1 Tax=Pochonia chlamydosporia 170 TaxID=1380566 RepID=A0A179G5Y7_METCM|nr:hypothetical protein VFPPC_12957 [Pochonia chlamydosporia 170]OAQ73237.1 hypothetical protein VFPPC_12957 [Pochonia chlamydosporia 170]